MHEIHEIYQKYYNIVMKYALALTKNYHLAEDLTQETFYKAIKTIHTFNGDCKISVWLCQILKNLFYDYCRKENKVQNEINGEPYTINTPEHEVINNELILKIFQYISELEEPYKQVFELRYFYEMSYNEISLQYHKSEAWARVTYYRGKEQIKRKIEEDFGHEM